MPDISMCANHLCKNEKECFRFIAKPSKFCQTYADFEVKKFKTKCEHFIKLYEEKD